jgi:SagB-type dehydrogenase family enzyme
MSIDQKRLFMQSGFYTTPLESDQVKGLPQPPFEKPADPASPVFDLPKPDPKVIVKHDIFACMADRRSRRKFTGEPLSLEELAFLLWATQGVREVIPGRTFRTVPSAGSRHPYETYLAVKNVAGLQPGIYRYLALSHKLVQVTLASDIPERMIDLSGGIKWIGDAAVTFIWAANAYRNQWRYEREGPRVMLIDVGHICQNLYLATEALGCGTCGIGAYKQAEIDKWLGLDGNEEYVVYYAPVGRL